MLADVHFYQPDADLAYRQARAAGAAPVQEPGKNDDRHGGLKGPGGTTRWIAPNGA